MPGINLTDHFLIAMPGLEDTFFARTLTYVCEHNEQGALGLVVNRPTDMSVEKLLLQLGMTPKNTASSSQPVLLGGPVQIDSGFVLHEPVGAWKSTLSSNESVGLTASIDILQAVANCQGPERMLVALGYSGWVAGQLEQELAQNVWLTVPAESQILFELSSEERLPAAIKLLGIDFCNLSSEVGHA
ncbi:YqgE/AlgH family protein [Betaproteobacteria bacterium PRO4]|uniref:YqgE/AlgH family protein n=1 Tax=Nitrosomonas sp. TaxID=42353 RepID=UPI00255FF865|nr:YqgE/AlgH family protein [Nitrosomonas sp.]MBE7527779.1 YqgE/AlgH family protein [Burkholderiales bacterium]MDL1866735.1 YqgE/AlgH family protein [Betaproteobacteria bacterium PRO4]